MSELTPRQCAVASLVSNGVPTKRIAAQLAISERRVRVHITAIAYVLHLDPTRSVRLQIALWWRAKAAPVPGLHGHTDERTLEESTG